MAFSADGLATGKILRGVETFNFDGNSLYDKIINLRLIRKDGSAIVIRSDYELVKVQNAGKYRYEFRTVRQKPSISVSYRQVGGETLLRVDIRISNLFFSEGDEAMFNGKEGGNPVVQIKMNMGYRSQFRAWPQQVKVDQSTIDSFYNLDDFVYRSPAGALNSGFTATIRVLDSWPEANPPERTVYFHGIVGAADKGMKFELQDKSTFSTWFKNPENFPSEERLYMQRIFFLYVTRRFFRSDVLWRHPQNDDGTEDEERYEVYGWARTGEGGELQPMTEEEKAGKEPSDMWAEVELSDGCMSVKDACALGVPVILSQKVREDGEAAARLVTASTTGGDTEAVGNGETVPSVVPMDYLPAQVREVEQSVMSGLKVFPRPDGSIMICAESESKEDVFDNYEDEIMYKYSSDPNAVKPVLLPAIYDRTVNGTRTLRLPFIGFLSTGMYLGFTSRYTLGSLVGFYYPHKEDKWYKVIWADIEFDTDGDKNMCTATCVDADSAPGERELQKKEEPEPPERSVEWVDCTCSMTGAGPFTFSTLQWAVLANMTLGAGGVASWQKPDGSGEFLDGVADAFPGGKYNSRAAVQLLIDKNPSLKKASFQNGTDEYAGLELPWLRVGDVVSLPFVKED